MLLVEVLIADTTSLRSRLIFSYVPALPFLVRFGVINNLLSPGAKIISLIGYRSILG